MMTDVEDVIALDAEDLNDSDMLVLSLISKKRLMRTRLQKTALLYCKIFDTKTVNHVAYNFGGYSEDVDESLDTLIDLGAIAEDKGYYSTTEYGKKLISYLEKTDGNYVNMDRDTEKVSKSLDEVSDRELIGLSYHYYPELAKESTIKESVERMNKTLTIDDTPLSYFDKGMFEKAVMDGKILKVREK